MPDNRDDLRSGLSHKQKCVPFELNFSGKPTQVLRLEGAERARSSGVGWGGLQTQPFITVKINTVSFCF